MKEIIKTSNAPTAIGPYSQAVKANGVLYVSGQIPINPKSGEIETLDIKQQTKQALQNLQAVLQAGGCQMSDVVKTTCYLSDMNNFGEMNAVYADFFKDDSPARATVEVSRLPKDVLIEIDAIAVK